MQRFVTSDGTALCVADDGAGNERATVVLVHGWTQDHTSWDRVVERLPSGIRVLRHDHRGHGGSSPAKPGTATIDTIADDLAELLDDRVPHGPILLVGHSMGGATLMAFVQRHPRFVERLIGVVFVGTTSGGLSELTFGLPRVLAKFVIDMESRVSPHLSKVRRRAFVRRPAVLRPMVRHLTFGAYPVRSEVKAVAEQIGRCHPASMIGFLDSLLLHDRRGALAQLSGVPTTIVVGTRDKLCPQAHSRVISDELPTANYVVFPEAGHMLASERPTEVTEAISAML